MAHRPANPELRPASPTAPQNVTLHPGAAAADPALPVTANLWMHLTARAGVSFDGSNNLTAWLDQGPLANHVNQIHTTAPKYVVSSLDGRPGVRTHANSFFGRSSWVSGALPEPCMWYMVGTLRVVAATTVIMFGSFTDASQRLATTAGTAYRVDNGGTLGGGTPDTSPHLHTLGFEATTDDLLIDGTSVISGNAGASSSTGFRVGSLHTGAVNLSDLDINELIVYSVAHTTERAQIRSWAQSIYPSLP